jgi:hypothetical protein
MSSAPQTRSSVAPSGRSTIGARRLIRADRGAVGADRTGFGGTGRIAIVTATPVGHEFRGQLRESAHGCGFAGATIAKHQNSAQGRLDRGQQQRVLHLILTNNGAEGIGLGHRLTTFHSAWAATQLAGQAAFGNPGALSTKRSVHLIRHNDVNKNIHSAAICNRTRTITIKTGGRAGPTAERTRRTRRRSPELLRLSNLHDIFL